MGIRRFSILLLVSWLSSSLVHAQPSQPQTSQPQTTAPYAAEGVIFEAPAGFSELKSLGNQTMGVVFPAAAQERRVSVRLVELQPNQRGFSELGPGEWSNYVRFSYFGLTTPPQSRKARRFFGQEVLGDVIMRPANGSMAYLEFYLIPLTEERQLAIAFETDTELPIQWFEDTVNKVAATLREDPDLKRKRK